MKKKTTTRITIQTERFVVMSRGPHRICVECGNEAHMVTIDEAALLTSVNQREIYRRVETGEIHFMETATGALLVCFNSLSA